MMSNVRLNLLIITLIRQNILFHGPYLFQKFRHRSVYFFPLPPLEEQREIVRQVDKLFAFADKLEEHYKKSKEKIDKLPQSVLAKAFRGELVPQDPNDEPASYFANRIKPPFKTNKIALSSPGPI